MTIEKALEIYISLVFLWVFFFLGGGERWTLKVAGSSSETKEFTGKGTLENIFPCGNVPFRSLRGDFKCEKYVANPEDD